REALDESADQHQAYQYDKELPRSLIRSHGLACSLIPNADAAGFAQQQASHDKGDASDNHRVIEPGINVASGRDGRESNQWQQSAEDAVADVVGQRERSV